MTTKITRVGLVGASAAAIALALSGCSLLGLGGADRDEDGQVTDTSTDSVFSMQVGDCLNEPEGTEVYDVELVPCTEAHDYEVYDEIELEAGDFPSDIDTQAEEFCLGAFEEFIGVAWEESELDATWFTPTQSGWEQDDDRLIQCIAYDPAGQTTGTLAGAAK